MSLDIFLDTRFVFVWPQKVMRKKLFSSPVLELENNVSFANITVGSLFKKQPFGAL